MEILERTLHGVVSTGLDVLPLVAILFLFQFLVLRRRPPNLGRLLVGVGYVMIGLALFVVGLEEALFPIGRTMAEQLTTLAFAGRGASGSPAEWADYLWVYAFAAATGFATTIAEPSLIAISLKANQVSGGAIPVLGLRLAVAAGVAVGVAIGAARIVTGAPLPLFIIAGYVVVIVQTAFTPRLIIPIAYDSGGVTTSTVTVPVVTALGLGLAANIPGRDPLIDGFGLIAFASVFPIISVQAYACFAERLERRSRHRQRPAGREAEQ